MQKIFIVLLSLFCILSGYAEHKKFTKRDGFLSIPDKLDVYFFDSQSHYLVLRDEGSVKKPKYGSLDAAMKKSPCVAGVNGGFFGADVDGIPLGLTIQDGKRLSPLATGSFVVLGVVYQEGKDIKLERSSVFKKRKSFSGINTAVQGGPFLVEKGKVVKGLDNKKSAFRTFIATDGKGKWCLGVSSALTLHELATWLQKPKALGNFQIQTALNFDGGSSSAFWCYESGVSYPSYKQVRNYLGVAPRQQQ